MSGSSSNSSKCPGGHFQSAGRRGFIQVGALSALGLTMADLFRMQARADDKEPRSVSGKVAKEGQAKSVIQIFLPGGCPHQESWDPKPDAPVEYRGPLGVVKTCIPGVCFNEFLPKTAKIADKISVIRSIAGRIPDHEQATYHLLTGYLPTPAIVHPSMGAVIAQQFGPRKNLPPYVGVPNVQGKGGGTGYLSSKFGAFELGADPGSSGFKVRDVSLPKNVDTEQFGRRKSAREAVEAHLKSLEADPKAFDAMDSFYQRAYNLISSPEAQKAFNLDDESQKTIDLYGADTKDKNGNNYGVGRRLMMSRRLIEAGVRFVSVNYGGWDLHVNVKDNVARQMPGFDHAFSGLITDLDQRGLLDSTIVMVLSEFGRSPKINPDGGRDHYSRVFSLAVAGGGLTRGNIYGASSSTASEVENDPVTVEDFLYTCYHQLGIDADERLIAPGDRPIDIIRGGKLVKGLVAKA